MVTGRFIVLWLAGGVPVLLVALAPGWLAVVIAWHAALVILAVADWLAIPPRSSLSARRILDDSLTQGIPARVAVEVANESSRRAEVAVKDMPPADFQVSRREMSTRLEAGTARRLEYEVLSYERGRFRFADIYLRATGPLGLCWRQYRHSAGADVTAGPDVKAITREQLALELGAQSLFARRRMRHWQRGSEFAHHREYYPGDDYRHISWKASARRGRLVTKEYEVQRSQPLFILMDTARMMTTRIGPYSRLDYAVNAALQLAGAALRRHDLVGALAFSGEVKDFLPVSKGTWQWRRIVDFMGSLQPDYSEPDFASAYAYLLARTRQRSLIVTFTDLANPAGADTLARYNIQIARHHLPLCVSIEDSDVAAEAARAPRKAADVYRKAVACEVVQDTERTIARLERGGVLVVHVGAHTLSSAAVRRYLEIKYRNLL